MKDLLGPRVQRALLALVLLALLAPACGDADDDDGGDADADADADGDGDACSLDCSGLSRAAPYLEQEALPTCEDNAAWSRDPEILNVRQDEQGRVVHWEVTYRYQNNHQFVVRYDASSFCEDGTFESLQVAAESFDPMGTWSCDQFFICL